MEKEYVNENGTSTKIVQLNYRTSDFGNRKRLLYVPEIIDPKSKKPTALKKLSSFLAIIGIILASNCSQIPENNDPVIGVWANPLSTATSETDKNPSRQEWIFNDAFLGRYHSYENMVLAVKTDFKWVHENGMYIITYPGTDIPDQSVILQESQEGSLLRDPSGNVVAVKE